jgi:uncharacterized protein YodC (DUF2158 family)
MEEIKKGNVVGLKSGSISMTVEDIGDYSGGGGPRDGVACVWYEGNMIARAVFDRAVLRIIET